MKPKNLILIAVAVVCGLVAAFLTARMTAGASKPKDVDMVDVPVAARDIPIGTKIPPKDLETFFVLKKFPREAVPPNAVLTLDEIADKRTMRAVRQGESVNVADVNAKSFIDPPDGTVLMSTPISLDQSASGFALPGYKVVVIASKKSQKKNVEIVFPLFIDVLVLAVDTSPSAPQVSGGSGGGSSGSSGSGSSGSGSGGQGGATAAGFQTVSMISLAVTPEQSELMAMAAQGGASLRLGLPPQDETKKKVVIDAYEHLRPTNDQIRKIFADDWGDKEKSEEPKAEVVTAKVPTEPLPWGTQLTQEVLDKKFKEVSFPKELLPETAVTDEKDLLDKYATTDLVPSLLVPKPHLSKSEPKKPDVIPVKPGEPMAIAGAKAGFNEEAASPKGETDTTKAAPAPKEYVYVTISTPQGKKVQKYEVTPKGNILVDEFAGDAPLDGKEKKDESKDEKKDGKEPKNDKGA